MSRNPEAAKLAGKEKSVPEGGATTSFLAAPDGLPIAFRDHGGDGPTLILIHGWSCRQDFWAPQIGSFKARYRVVTMDLPGHGDAAASVGDRDWSIAAFGSDVVHLADALGSESVTLVGHSMGGAVAVEAAIRLGDRCRFVLGVDTFNEAAFYRRRPAGEIRERCAVFERDFAGTMRGMVQAITDPHCDPAVAVRIGEAMAASRQPVALAVLEQLLAWDIEARWPEFTAPVATINSAMLAARNELIDLPRLDVRHLDGVGHFPMLEDPVSFNALALKILAGSAA